MAETTKSFLGKYELLEVIGDGAEGRVYKAICLADDVPGLSRGERVAIKRLKSAGNIKDSQQFLRQIKILSKLNHPNIVQYKDSFVWREKEINEDIYCLVMELLDGETLKSLIEKDRVGLPWRQANVILHRIISGLQYASKNGVVHRDLKPSNIYITRAGIPKLLDFGIARMDDGESTKTTSSDGAKGTFDYMAPDFALLSGGFRGDEQSDIFSFGVLLHYTLAGALPFPPLGENATSGYYKRWLGNQPPHPEFRHPVFRVLAHARSCIAKCIDPDRAERFKTFDELMADFAQIGYRKLKHGCEIYEFTDWLGKGGFGEVFRARRVSDWREVAVKRLFSSGQSSRFVREAKILRDAPHPNLAEYVDFVEIRLRENEKEYYLILEYLEGMPEAGLRARIKNSENGLDPTEALQLFVRYLDCLEHLHKIGIIHRDIKPGNLYAPAGNPEKAKIFDLGNAYDEEGTRTHGQVPGTLDFMPPEFATQSSGRGSAQSDIYSIGVTLYQALTKSLPFPRLPEKESEAWVAFFKRAQNLPVCTFDHPVFKTHPELVPLLRRSLAADPANRFESAGVMRDACKTLLQKWVASAYDYDDRANAATANSVAPSPLREKIEAATNVTDLPSIEKKVPQVPVAAPSSQAELERQKLAAVTDDRIKRKETESLANIKAARKFTEAAEKQKLEEIEGLAREKKRLVSEENTAFDPPMESESKVQPTPSSEKMIQRQIVFLQVFAAVSSLFIVALIICAFSAGVFSNPLVFGSFGLLLILFAATLCLKISGDIKLLNNINRESGAIYETKVKREVDDSIIKQGQSPDVINEYITLSGDLTRLANQSLPGGFLDNTKYTYIGNVAKYDKSITQIEQTFEFYRNHLDEEYSSLSKQAAATFRLWVTCASLGFVVLMASMVAMLLGFVQEGFSVTVLLLPATYITRIFSQRDDHYRKLAGAKSIHLKYVNDWLLTIQSINLIEEPQLKQERLNRLTEVLMNKFGTIKYKSTYSGDKKRRKKS